MNATELRAAFTSIGQGHVFRFYDVLSAESQRKLLTQLAGIDLKNLPELVDEYIVNKPMFDLPKEIKPVQAYPAASYPLSKEYQTAYDRGIALLKAGKVGAFLVAGGQGTRLGYDGPKGEFPVTPVSSKPLFQVFAEQLLAWSKLSGKTIAWYVMTSDTNDARTRQFFKDQQFFGYPSADVFFFAQGMMPAFGYDGKLLLSEKDSLALSPDGHGGSLRALEKSGALADMLQRGVEHLSYFQVDNPIVHTIDPLFLGLHEQAGSEMSSKTISKASPLEKVGNFCIGDAKLQVIEYSDLPNTLAEQRNAAGGLLFNAGSIAIHALRVDFVKRLNAGEKLELPWHRAEKKIPFVDESAMMQKPENNNGVKLEQFVFDAIPLAKNAIVFTTDRAQEFSPVKNAEGGDSPMTSRADQVKRAAGWLETVGVAVPRKPDGTPDCVVEISPLFAPSLEVLATKQPRLKIESGAKLVIE